MEQTEMEEVAQSTPPPGFRIPKRTPEQAGTSRGEVGATSFLGGNPDPPEDEGDELTHLWAGGNDTKLRLSDDSIAFQFGESCDERDVPDFRDMLSAVCLGYDSTGP